MTILNRPVSSLNRLGLVIECVEKTRQLGDFDDTTYSNIPGEFTEQHEEQRLPEHLEHLDSNWYSSSSGSLDRFCCQFV